MPSRASISRTRWPLPKPPMAGLQDIAPMVVTRWVTSAVRAPRRAAAAAASVPAWPPPTTMTSKPPSIQDSVESGAFSRDALERQKTLFHVKQSLADTEIPENDVQDIFDVNFPRQPAQSTAGEPQLLCDDFLAAGPLRQGTFQGRFGQG